MSEVKSAQITISEHWPDHVHCKTVGKAPRWDAELGVVCACAEVLGWPDPERKETLSAYTRRVAKEQVDAASAPGRVKGAFGTYSRPTPEPEDGEPAAALPGGDNAPEPGDYPDPEVQQPPAAHDDDPGPDEPDDGVDWGEPPADEPEPEILEIEDPHVAAVAARVEEIVGADEAQAVVPSGHGWNDGERSEEAEIADGSQREYSGGMSYGPADEAQADLPPSYDKVIVGGVEVEPVVARFVGDDKVIVGGPDDGVVIAQRSESDSESSEIGRDLVPYAGTPIMPTEAEVLDPLIGRLAPLDPTLPYTPADVELKIVEILRQLENSELFLRQQLARLHQATHNHDFRYNLALAKSDQRAADQRKAEAWLATEKERHEMTEADMLVRALRDSQHNLRSQLSGFQSVARSLAVSMVNSLDGRERPPLPPEPPRWT
jgi:hypothetical protein